jgi:hypothetical protein
MAQRINNIGGGTPGSVRVQVPSARQAQAELEWQSIPGVPPLTWNNW